MAGGIVVTVRRALRLPTVAECAELLAGGWPPVLGRLGVWVDDSGDSRAVVDVGAGDCATGPEPGSRRWRGRRVPRCTGACHFGSDGRGSDRMTTDGDTMAHGVALRLRALAATRWIDRSDAATREALLAGADEVERLCEVVETLRRTIDAGDLAGLARREAGPVTRRQWRACARCGQCFWLADDEAVPGHGVRDAWGADRACGAVVTSEGSEGR